MTQDTAFVFLLIGIAAALMASSRVRYDLVAFIVVLGLILGDILTVREALSGFGSPVVMMVACLLVVGHMLERTGVARAIGNMILMHGGENETRLLFLIMTSAAFLGSIMSSTAVVAIFIPIVLQIADKTRLDKARMLLPMSYAALISGMLTLIATTPNLVISDELVDHGFAPLGFFEFFPLGLGVLVIAIAYILLWGRRVLGSKMSNVDASSTTPGTSLRSVWDCFRADENVESFFVNRRHSHEELLELCHSGLEIFARIRGANGDPIPFREGMGVEVKDKILVGGNPENLADLSNSTGMSRIGTVVSAPEEWLATLGVADVLVHPGASAAGKTSREALRLWSKDLFVLGMIRNDEPIVDFSHADLQSSDRLLVAGPWSDVDALTERHNEFVLLSSPKERREIPPARAKFKVGIAILVVMVLLSALSIVSVTVAVLGAAIAAILLRTMSADDAYRSLNLPSLVLIAGMLPLANALEMTGGSDLIVETLLEVVGEADPRMMMASLFCLTALLGLVLSNTASAVLIAPIAIVAAAKLGVSPYPLAISVLFAASASFSTPISTPIVTLVVTPGGYSFADFLRLGVPLTLLVGLVTVVAGPMLFPF